MRKYVKPHVRCKDVQGYAGYAGVSILWTVPVFLHTFVKL